MGYSNKKDNSLDSNSIAARTPLDKKQPQINNKPLATRKDEVQVTKKRAADGPKNYDGTQVGLPPTPPDGQYTGEQLRQRLQNHADQHENAIHAAYTPQTSDGIKSSFKGVQQTTQDTGKPLQVGTGQKIPHKMVKDASPVGTPLRNN